MCPHFDTPVDTSRPRRDDSRRPHAWCRAVALAAAVLAASVAQAQPADTPDLMRRADIPGLAVATVADGQVEASYYGLATSPADSVRATTLFEAASLTKPVVAYLALRLVDRGRLALDAPLVGYGAALPLPAGDPRRDAVTLRMALAHSTGLDGDDSDTLRFSAEPGETFRYFPAGYRLVQRVVEHVEGAPLDALAAREVFGPLGMRSSSLVWTAALATTLASRHDALGNPIVRARSAEAPANAAASLLTTAEDYGRFLAAVLSGAGLTARSREDMVSPQVRVPGPDSGLAWGLGWGLETARGTFFHWGDDGAAKAFAIGSVADRTALAYFANSTYGLAIAREMASAVAPGSQPAVDWLDYAAWDAPVRLARRDVLRAFVDGGATGGVAALAAARAAYPQLDLQTVVSWVSWALDSRGRTAERDALLAWRPEP